jgi:hypothetical protein
VDAIKALRGNPAAFGAIGNGTKLRLPASHTVESARAPDDRGSAFVSDRLQVSPAKRLLSFTDFGFFCVGAFTHWVASPFSLVAPKAFSVTLPSWTSLRRPKTLWVAYSLSAPTVCVQ